jgi:alkanesulfonate monooxygenase SsuD/methylene tetrahydromethanopterin reductase-like flavin-dependent oxidoreductase (luciferase family)
MPGPRFGVQFRNFPIEYNGRILGKMLEVCKKCEDLNYDSIWMVDHLEMRPPISYENQPIPECWSTLSALAAFTSKLKVGSLVSCVLFRNPTYLGEICKTVARISNNRLIVGLGAGWFEQEFSSFGLEYPKAGDRVLAVRRTLELLRKTRNDSRFSIWVGGSGEELTLKLVAQKADGCSLFGDPKTIERKLKRVEEYCASLGRDSSEITKSKHSNVVIGSTHSEVAGKLEKILPDRSKWEIFANSNIVGTPSECQEQVKKYLEIGADYLTLSFPDLLESKCLDIFSNEVIQGLI